VRHGHLPEREIMTGIGPVAIRQPRVRDRQAAEGPLGGRDAPLRLIRSSLEKIAIMKLGSTSAMPISRAPSPPVDERCAGYKIETAGGAKRTLLLI
jgi:putative transposase